MTKTEFIRIVSRVFALYLLVCAVMECTYFPQFLNSLIHRLNETADLQNMGYWKRYYVLETASLTVRAFGYFLGSLIFWNPGQRVLSLLGASGKAANPLETPES
jgi:hypothetical protein